MKKLLVTLVSLWALTISSFGQKVVITSKPDKIFIEQGEAKQSVNFDFHLANTSNDTLTLVKVLVSVLDEKERVIHSKFLDNNGTAPSIRLIPNRIFNGVSSQLIFNPFAEFNLTTPLSKLSYEFTFADNADNELKVNSIVLPQKYQQKEKFSFPLKGKVLVYDGHDLYAHHRRFDYEFAPIKALGISANFMRYAYDFVVLDADHKQFASDGSNDTDYVSFGKSVYAVADGKVIYASNVHRDDKSFDIPGIAKNPLELYGNCVAIQHADNSISIYGHLKQNSITVKSGDQVKALQEIGAIGVSGSSFFPHLHFEVRTSIQSSAEGLPSYFSNVYLLEGKVAGKLKSGVVETGQIIEAK